jgi:hypothetical protein
LYRKQPGQIDLPFSYRKQSILSGDDVLYSFDLTSVFQTFAKGDEISFI